MNRPRLGVVCVLVAVVVAACYPPAAMPTPAPVPELAPIPLLETRWTVKRLDGAPPAVPDLPLTLIFGGRDTVIGDGGCTEFRGAFVASGNSITLGPLSTGTASCGVGVDSQERAYLQALQAATTYQIDNDELVLLDAGGKELVRLSRWGGSEDSPD